MPGDHDRAENRRGDPAVFCKILQKKDLTISKQSFIIKNMRTIDTEKRDRVVQTVLQITMEEGLAALSFDKLAKRAGISTGTPYVYYKDKTDMLSCIYGQVWLSLQEGLQQAIDMGRTPGEKLFSACGSWRRPFWPIRRRRTSSCRC